MVVWDFFHQQYYTMTLYYISLGPSTWQNGSILDHSAQSVRLGAKWYSSSLRTLLSYLHSSNHSNDNIHARKEDAVCNASANQTHEIKHFRWCVVDRSIMKCIPKTNLDDQTNSNLQQTNTPYMELPSNDS